MLNFDARRKLPTLLLIDDDLVSREVTATVLTMNGYNVHTAEGGAAATAMLDAAECKPDVILMDIFLPRMSGIDCTAKLKMLMPKTPILMLTAMAVYVGSDDLALVPWRHRVPSAARRVP